MFVHDRLPSSEVLLFKLNKVFEISGHEGVTRFRVVLHSMAVFAEEYAVDDIVEGKIEESVCKMTGVLLENDSLGWKGERER